MNEKLNEREYRKMYSIGEFKEAFDPLLEDFIDERISEFGSLTTDESINEMTMYTKRLLTGGKRLRPYLAYTMYKAYGGENDEEAMRLLVSMEIFHMFALVHDDVMDKASTRRGEKTVHKFVLEKLQGFGDLPHIANSQAILVGDLLMSWSLGNFQNKDFQDDNFAKARGYFYKMIDEVILGQMLDVDIATKEEPGRDLIDEKTRLKTSRYTCVRPMQIGASLADKNYGEESFFEQLGTKVGIAFQVQDDLLAIVGTHETLTKDILIDVEEHQHTFFTNYIFENCTSEQKEEFKKYFGRKLSDDEKEQVKTLFKDSGAIDEGRELISKMLNGARELVDKSNFEDIYKEKMGELLDIMEKRQS